MARSSARIIFSARAVVAVGEPFAPCDEPLHDVDVALDWISDHRPTGEPLVLRVTSDREPGPEFGRVVGDWLCLADGSAPRRIPWPSWRFDDESARWSSGHSWLDAWETCENARWMLWEAALVGTDGRSVVRAACDCARTALPLVRPGETRPLRAIEAAESWCVAASSSSSRTEAAANAAAPGASEAAIDSRTHSSGRDSPSSSAAHAAACVAYAAVGHSGDATAYATSGLAGFVSYALAYASHARRSRRTTALREMADLVRARIPALSVLRAASCADDPPRKHVTPSDSLPLVVVHRVRHRGSG